MNGGTAFNSTYVSAFMEHEGVEKSRISLKDMLNLFVVAPHTASFIGDSLKLIAREVASINVAIPVPFVPKLLQRTSRFSDHEKLVRLIQNNPVDGTARCVIKYPLLPFDWSKKRSGRLISGRLLKIIDSSCLVPNFLHAHFLHPCGHAAVFLKDKLKIPLVITAHGQDVYSMPFLDSEWKNIALECISSADKIITVCEKNKDILVSLGAKSSDIQVIPNGYDPELFYPRNKAACRSFLGLSKSSRLLLFVGNLLKEKGIFDLLQAFKSVSQKDSGLCLVIVGSGRLCGEVQKWVLENNLSSKVFLVGDRPHSEIPVWMNACDLLVLPSYREGFPTVIVEAMACGLPVLSTSVGGIPEAISEDYLGALVTHGDVQGLADQILTCLSSSYSRELIVNHSKQFEWPSLCRKTLSLYETLC